MIIRVVRMTFQPEAVETFRGIFQQSKNQIAAAPGCRHLELWQDTYQPSIFTTYSHWDSETDLNRYRYSELFGQVWPATKKLFAAPPQAFTFRPVEVIKTS
jgi:quinol monooxygenase YgiN